MKKSFITCAAALLFTGLFISNIHPLHAQTGAIAVLDSAALEEQLDFIQEKTRVYNDFRAIRDDIFLKLMRNVKDTLNATQLEVEELKSRLTERNFRIETLNSDLTRIKNEKDEAIRNRDSLSLFGIQMRKGFYSTVLWFIIIGLAALAVSMVMLFRRSHQVTSHVKDELLALEGEFEEHKRSSREKYEKLVVAHHSEIIKLKNS
jgi:uncharacterized protein YdaL